MSTSNPDLHDQILFVAEKVGELSERFDKIEKENLMAGRSVDASKASIDGTVTALNAALSGLKALNYHVLDNNLGAVSTRVEELAAKTERQASALAKSLDEARQELASKNEATATKLAKVSEARIELTKRTDKQRTELAESITSMRGDIAEIETALENRIGQAMLEFAAPSTFEPKGKWDAATTYKKLAVVELNGSSYVSNESENGEKPGRGSKKWTLIARRGAASAGGGVSDITGVAGMGATGLQIAQAGTPLEVRTITGTDDFTGATADDDGTAGRVIQPSAGDQNKYLRADGTWTTPSSVTAPAASQATVDAGTVDDEYVSPLTLGKSGPINSMIAARAPRQALRGDGSNASGTSAILNDQDPASGDFMAGGPIIIPDDASATEQCVWAFTSSLSTTEQANAFVFYYSTSGWIFRLYGATTGDYIQLASTSALSDYAAKAADVYIARDASGASASVYINSADATASFTETTSGTSPGWGGLVAGTYWRTHYRNSTNSSAAIVFDGQRLYNAAPDTLAEAADAMSPTPVGPKWQASGDGGDVYSTGDAGSFGAGDANTVATWVQNLNATVAAVAATRTGGSGSYVVETTKTSDSGWRWGIPITLPSVGEGEYVEISFWARVTTGGSHKDSWALRDGVAASGISLAGPALAPTISGSDWVQYKGVVQLNSSATTSCFLVNRTTFEAGTNADVTEYDDFRVVKVGQTVGLDLSDGGGYQPKNPRFENGSTHWEMSTSGIDWTVPANSGKRIAVTKTYTHDKISSTAATTLHGTLPPSWSVKAIQLSLGTAFDASTTLDFGITGTATRYASAMAVDFAGFNDATSSRLCPESTTANTSVWIKKNQVTTVGEVTVTAILERTF